MNVKKHVAQGLSTGEANSRYPPKVQLISKYERRTDRRTFQERKALFEVEQKRLEGLELLKPAAKKREGWVKGKKPAGADDEEEEEGGQEADPEQEQEQQQQEQEESNNNDHAEEVQEEEAAEEEEGESIW